jgi:Undecaprenyl-phosphate glucose phosphotransferase
MLKKHQSKFETIHKLNDFSIATVCWILSYYIRFESGLQGGAQEGLEEIFFKFSPVLGILTFYFFRKEGLYRSQRFERRSKEIFSVMSGNIKAILAFIVILYFSGLDRLSRLTLLNYFLLSNFFLIATRIILRNLLRSLRKKGHNLRHILLIGNGNQMINYIHTVRKFKDSGVNIKGWLDSEGLNEKEDIKHLSGDLDQIIEKDRPDFIVIGYQGKDFLKVDSILKNSHLHLTPIQILPDLTHSVVGHQISDFSGIPVISINHPQFNSFDAFLKRLLDIIGSIIAIILFSPFFIILSILVKLTSKGPIFYGQERVGFDGESFKMWKFRSMRIDAEEQSGAVWAKKDDPRRTPIGTFLRSTSLDEIPQFWNVLKGEMSLVGPRPERPVFVDQFKQEIPAYMLRHKVKSGITGLAQVNGWRGDTSLHKRIECDIEYIKNWSIYLDVKILFLTVWSGFINKNAY